MYVAASATAANVVFAGCQFQECSSLPAVRPLWLEATAVLCARFNDSTFRRNSALFSGGAVYVTGVAFKAAVTRCTAERSGRGMVARSASATFWSRCYQLFLHQLLRGAGWRAFAARRPRYAQRQYSPPTTRQPRGRVAIELSKTQAKASPHSSVAAMLPVLSGPAACPCSDASTVTVSASAFQGDLCERHWRRWRVLLLELGPA